MELKVGSGEIKFTRLECKDDGEWFGSGEPYLWTIFFRIDQSTVNKMTIRAEQRAGQTVYIGKFEQANVFVTPHQNGAHAGHGNIGGGMDSGDNRNISSYECCDYDFGEVFSIPIYWEDSTEPMDVTAPIIVGTIAILWEEDYTPNHAVKEGYVAFVNAVKEGLENFLQEYEFDFLAWLETVLSGGEPPETIPDEAITELTNNIENKIRNAIETAISDDASFWDTVMAFLDPDNVIGSKVWYWTSDEWEEGSHTRNFEKRWKKEGDWKLKGEFYCKTGIIICFIATAAYGSPYAEEVQHLRFIRDRRITRSLLGATAVDKFEAVYYLYSPFIARAMRCNPYLCTFMRKVVVAPIVKLLSLLFDR